MLLKTRSGFFGVNQAEYENAGALERGCPNSFYREWRACLEILLLSSMFSLLLSMGLLCECFKINF